MRILITNDDGIYAVGIRELALALKKAGHELFIAAPSEDQSCISHGLTLRKPLYVDRVVLKGLEDIPAYSVSGTPCDCVRFAVSALGADPEVIVSGINHAPNLGTDAVCSGTVSAAIEGYIIDIPSIAVSKDTFDVDHMSDAAEFFSQMFPELYRSFDNGPGMLSVNIPSAPISRYRGIRVAKIAKQKYRFDYYEITDDEGRSAFKVHTEKLTECLEDEKNDEKMMRDGFVVVTPLTYDITEYSSFERAANMFERDF